MYHFEWRGCEDSVDSRGGTQGDHQHLSFGFADHLHDLAAPAEQTRLVEHHTFETVASQRQWIRHRKNRVSSLWRPGPLEHI
eukprot:10966729-Heterocapsa_arctica.AAC.1